MYPGSHAKLAAHFRREGLEELRAHGNKVLPTGSRTDAMFGGAAPHHCVGKAGDVFIANYLTAHFIAPNTSADIRYAVYFRVYGPRFDALRSHDPRPMLFPWRNWHGVGGDDGDNGGSEAARALDAARGEVETMLSPGDIAQAMALQRMYDGLSNDHTIPK